MNNVFVDWKAECRNIRPLLYDRVFNNMSIINLIIESIANLKWVKDVEFESFALYFNIDSKKPIDDTHKHSVSKIILDIISEELRDHYQVELYQNYLNSAVRTSHGVLDRREFISGLFIHLTFSDIMNIHELNKTKMLVAL